MNNAHVSRKYEVGAPTFERRLNAAHRVQQAGYPVRIRLDPIVPFDGWQDAYADTIDRIFEKISPDRITLGTLRFEKQFYNMRHSIFTTGDDLPNFLEEMTPMFTPKKVTVNGKVKTKAGKYSFSDSKRVDIFKFAINRIREHSNCKIALCKESAGVWNQVGLDLSKCGCVCQYDTVDMT
jgi:spore photoproduct lyase